MKNADAQDVAKQLQDLGKEPEQRHTPIASSYFGGNPNEKDTKKISIVADRRRNAILVQAPPAAMEGIANTIAALDEPIQDNSLAPKIVPLENVSAGDIEDVLNELFLKKTTQRLITMIISTRSRAGRPGRWAGCTARSASPARRPPTPSSSPPTRRRTSTRSSRWSRNWTSRRRRATPPTMSS